MSRLPIEIKEEAIKLRKKGYSIKEISNKLKISKSTASLWLRNIELNKQAIRRLDKRKLLPYYKSAMRWKKKQDEEKRNIELVAKKVVKKIRCNIDQAKIYCALLYWCEGSKSYNDPIRFVNSDPDLVKTFLFLFRKGFQVKESKFRVLMHLHSYHNEKAQKDFWSKLTQIPINQFNKTFLKPHTKKRIKENYPGCVAITYYDRKLARLVRGISLSFSKDRGIG